MSVDSKIPEIRFEVFSGEWEEKVLGELAEIVRGASPRPIEDPKWFDSQSSVGWLRIRDVTEQDGRIHYLEQRISKLGQEKTRVLHEKHLLLSIAASVGKPVVNYVETGVHDGFLIFKKPLFELEFMYQWLKSFEAKWQQFGQPGSQVNLNSDIVKSQVVAIPTNEEQTTIGNYFQQLDTLINQHQQKHDKLSSIKKSMLEKMFPKQGETIPKIRFKGFSGEWGQSNLGECTNLLTGNPFNSKEFTNEGIFLVRGMNVKRGYLDTSLETSQFWPSSKGLEDYFLKPEDIVIQMDGALIGKSYAKIKECNLPALLVQRVTRVRCNEVNSEFIYQYIQRDFLKHISGIKTETAVPHLSLHDIRNFSILLPKKTEQKIIGNYFQKLDELINQHQQQITKLKNIKQACLSKMFV